MELVLVNRELVLGSKVGAWERMLQVLGCRVVGWGSRLEELGSSALVPGSRELAWVV